MRRLILAMVMMAVLLGTMAGVASAHEHQICTPGAGDPVLGLEPFHGEDPTNRAILNNPNVSSAQYAAWGFHPLHFFLHLGPSSDDRAITVIRTDRGTCP